VTVTFVTFVTFVTLTPDLVRSYSAAMLWKIVLMFVLLVGLSPFMGCERFQRASKEECEQTVDHLVRLEARKRGVGDRWRSCGPRHWSAGRRD